MAKLITKERFADLRVPDLLVNVYCYGNTCCLKLHKRFNEEILEEKWGEENWLPLKLALKDLNSKDFLDFGKVSSYHLDNIYEVLRKDFWKGYEERLFKQSI